MFPLIGPQHLLSVLKTPQTARFSVSKVHLGARVILMESFALI